MKIVIFLPQWNWVFGGGYIWISDIGWIGVHNTVFLAIKCEVLYLNENIMFRLNLLAYSQYVLHIRFAPEWLRIWLFSWNVPTVCIVLLVIRYRTTQDKLPWKINFRVVFYSSNIFRVKIVIFLPQWNWVFGGGYICISGIGWIGVHNTVFLAIMRGFVFKWKYNVPPKPFGLFSVRVAHSPFWAPFKGIFQKIESPQWPFTGENVIGLGSVILYAGQNLWYF